VETGEKAFRGKGATKNRGKKSEPHKALKKSKREKNPQTQIRPKKG